MNTDTKEKDSKNYRFSLRILDAELLEKVEAEAKRSFRSVNEQINFILREYFEKKETP